MSAKVSVIIPTFDRRETLRDAIESVLGQDHRNLELIVVDDGSTDGTPALVDEVAERDGRVRSLRMPNGGAARARNAGIAAATGEFLAFLDSDDTWRPWHLGLLLAGLERFPEAGLIWAEMELTDAAGEVIPSSSLRDLLGAYRFFSRDELFSRSADVRELGVELPAAFRDRRVYVGDLFSAMLMGNLILTSSAMLRRRVAEDVGPFDERLSVGEDHDYFHRVARTGPVAFVDVPDTRYRSGRADKLAGPDHALPMARGYLQLVERALARDRDRITLAPSAIASARAHANRWVGELELVSGAPRAARGHLAESLRIRPTQAGAIASLALAFLPAAVTRRILDVRRTVRRQAPATR